MSHLFDLLDRYRRGGTVRRYHTHRLLRPPNNAEHSWGVALIAREVYRRTYGNEPPEELLVAALLHDVPEYDTGDMPAWVKRAEPDLREKLGQAEAHVIRRLGIATPPDWAVPLLKFADDLEHVWTCLDERRAGNVDVEVLAAHGVNRIKRLLAKLEQEAAPPIWLPVARELLSAIDFELRFLGGWHYRMTANKIDEGQDYFSVAGDVDV